MMKASDKIAMGIVMILSIIVALIVGVTFQSHHCIGYLEDGRKFVSTADGYDKYLLGREICVEKLPNGFYRIK